jgi:hypothetical protein
MTSYPCFYVDAVAGKDPPDGGYDDGAVAILGISLPASRHPHNEVNSQLTVEPKSAQTASSTSPYGSFRARTSVL